MAERRHQNLPTPIKALHDAAHLARLHGLAFDDGAWSARAFADLLAAKNRHGFGPSKRFYFVADFARWGGNSYPRRASRKTPPRIGASPYGAYDNDFATGAKSGSKSRRIITRRKRFIRVLALLKMGGAANIIKGLEIFPSMRF